MGWSIISEQIIINTYFINCLLTGKCVFLLFDCFFKICEGIIPSLSFCFVRLNQIISFWFGVWFFLVVFYSIQKGFFFPMSILVALPCICSPFNSQFLTMSDLTAHIADVVLPVCYTDSDTHSRQLHLRELLEKRHHIHLISFGMSTKKQTNLWCYLCLSKVGCFVRDRKLLTVLETTY